VVFGEPGERGEGGVHRDYRVAFGRGEERESSLVSWVVMIVPQPDERKRAGNRIRGRKFFIGR
jgi:hypothetical protein